MTRWIRTYEDTLIPDHDILRVEERPGGTHEEWRVLAGFKHRSRVQKIMAHLAADRLVRRYRHRWMLTEAGKTEAKHAAE